MADSIFSFSNVILFGVTMEDLDTVDRGATWKVRAYFEEEVTLQGLPTIESVTLDENDFVFVSNNQKVKENGVYRVSINNWKPVDTEVGDTIVPRNNGISLLQDYKKWEHVSKGMFELKRTRQRGVRRRRGDNGQLEDQFGPDARFAKIYGFSFDGAYYDLARPVVFLVHGVGILVTDPHLDAGPNRSRAPRVPELTGLAESGFDFGDDVRVWFYDKADYTIRMDVETGMFEDVLLAATLGGGPGGMEAAGMSARGMSARGMSARGMSARGMSARGMSARGGGGNGD